MIKLSVLILTLNEELNLGKCLEALDWCNDIVVLDSKSTDRTLEIANSHNARIFEREFDDYAAQRNFGINDIPYKNSWLLMIDADELVTPELVKEIEIVLSTGDPKIVLYRIRRKDFLFGCWIKRSSKYPIWLGRLIKIGKVRVEREINEEYIAEGNVGHLHQHILHYPFNKGISSWIEKHNRYSSMEADLKMRRGPTKLYWKNLFDRDPTIRRKGLKTLFHRLPARPFFIFLGLYFIRLGMIEGRAGFTYCILTTYYEYLIDVKCREIDFRRKGLPI
jgi:glycosyltransferase involved in cell wall biosynthesis